MQRLRTAHAQQPLASAPDFDGGEAPQPLLRQPANLPLMTVLCFVIGAGSVITMPGGVMLVVMRAFDRHLGSAIGIMFLGVGAGTLIMPSIMGFLAGPLGWRATFLVLSGMSLIFGLLAVLLIFGVIDSRSIPKDRRQDPATMEMPSYQTIFMSLHFWIIGVAVLVGSAVGYGAMAHVPAALSDRGYTMTEAAAGVGVVGLGLTFGRLVAAILMDRIFASLVALACFTLGAMGLIMLVKLPADLGAVVFVGVFLIGLIGGVDGDMAPVLTRRYFGPQGFNRVFALMIVFIGTGGTLGPVIFGYFHDRFGSYAIGFEIGAVAVLLSGIVVLFLGRYRFGAR